MRGKWNHTTPENVQDTPYGNSVEYILPQSHLWAVKQNEGESDDSQLIHPEIAMAIAAWWQSMANMAITAFASHGEILEDGNPEHPGLLEEIDREIAAYTFIPDVLGALRAYVVAAKEAAQE